MEENNLYGSICLSDIPRELIRTRDNGKKYLTITIGKRREVGKYGDTHFIKAYCKAADRKEGVNYFIGDLKPSTFNQSQQPTTSADPFAQEEKTDDGLPF